MKLSSYLLLLSLIAILGICGCNEMPSSASVNQQSNLQSSKPKDTLTTDNFKIVSYRGEWDDDRLRVKGEIKNIGNIPAGAEIEVIARNGAGELVDSQTFWPASINNIPPGQSSGIEYTISHDKTCKTLEVKVVRVKTWK